MKELFISGQRSAREAFRFFSLAFARWMIKPQARDSEVSNFSPAIPPSDQQVREAQHSKSSLIFSLSTYIREPLATTLSIIKKNERFLQKTERTRNSYGSTKQLKTHIKSFRIYNSDQFLKLDSSDPRSRILASFHFGDFLYGLNKLVALQPNAVTSKVLSQTKHSPIFLGNMNRGFGNKAPAADSQLIQAEVKAHMLAGFLRQQSTTLIMFADLPSSYGESTGVKFLGRSAWFPKGIAVLSLANKVPILPVICYSIGKNNYVEIGKQIEPVRIMGESKEAAVARITQFLVAFFEYFFRQHPEQWRYLNVLPKYFCEPRGKTQPHK